MSNREAAIVAAVGAVLGARAGIVVANSQIEVGSISPKLDLRAEAFAGDSEPERIVIGIIVIDRDDCVFDSFAGWIEDDTEALISSWLNRD